MKNRLKRLMQLPFCLYAWLITVIAVVFALLSVALVPVASLRHKLAKASSRMPFLLTGCAPKIIGGEHVPLQNAVMVANHASYVDGPLMKGYLPSRFSFVIKGEMRDIPIVHFLLRRAGSRFVERHRAGGSALDARRIVRAAQDGQSLAFFPEGTFRKEPGIGRFRAGAFMAAIKGRMPVLPVVITGTRHMLTADDWMLRPSRIKIRILTPILPDDPAFKDHKTLAAEARRRVLAAIDEPDLLAAEATETVSEPAQPVGLPSN
ncbi:MAG: 1-acyl-sn-glycerol-3-phosphate acyltransferase [Gammaproteobacteria bacterium]|nr:1-acyl-sn-glycerol-3-phosphate acyltransferase [Gammaproteobacteria bacterium]